MAWMESCFTVGGRSLSSPPYRFRKRFFFRVMNFFTAFTKVEVSNSRLDMAMSLRVLFGGQRSRMGNGKWQMGNGDWRGAPEPGLDMN